MPPDWIGMPPSLAAAMFLIIMFRLAGDRGSMPNGGSPNIVAAEAWAIWAIMCGS